LRFCASFRPADNVICTKTISSLRSTPEIRRVVNKGAPGMFSDNLKAIIGRRFGAFHQRPMHSVG
jgi:hypothetical protein